MSEEQTENKPKRKPGRPKGRKDSKPRKPKNTKPRDPSLGPRPYSTKNRPKRPRGTTPEIIAAKGRHDAKARMKVKVKHEEQGVEKPEPIPGETRIGRKPKNNLDEDIILNLAEAGCTHQEIAKILGTNPTTLRKYYSELIAQGHERMRVSLRRKQLEVAYDGNPQMLIWLGKNILGQRDNKQIEHNVNVNYDDARTKVLTFMEDDDTAGLLTDASDDDDDFLNDEIVDAEVIEVTDDDDERE